LDPNEKDRLFVEQFVQFSRKDHELGSGLGLHISKMLAEMMDGEIGVRDNQQAAVSGSVFWFTIHVKPPQYTVPDLSRASVTRPRSSSFTGRLPQKRASVMFSTPLTEEQAGVTVGSSSMVGMYSNSANATPALIERNTPVGFEQNSRRGSTNSRTSICVSSSGSLSSNLSIPLIGDMDKFLTHTDLPPDFLAMRRRSCLPRIPLATSSSHARNEGYPKGTVRPTSSSSGNKKDKGPERRLSVSADRAKTIPSMRILLVDDDPIVARVQSKQLSKSGHHVTVCASGTAALSTLTATEQPFDVCLLDLYMPVMDGVETVHLIRELDNANAQMLVLGCTSSSDAQDLQRCIAAGMDAVIDKAFRVGDFEEAYMRLIHHEGPARRNNAPTSGGASRSPNRSPSNNRQSSTSQSSVTNAS
jgi:CheY-like chemotaxis protein